MYVCTYMIYIKSIWKLYGLTIRILMDVNGFYMDVHLCIIILKLVECGIVKQIRSSFVMFLFHLISVYSIYRAQICCREWHLVGIEVWKHGNRPDVFLL